MCRLVQIEVKQGQFVKFLSPAKVYFREKQKDMKTSQHDWKIVDWDVKIQNKQGTSYWQMSQCMRFPSMWYVRPAKAQTSLRICAVWSEPLLVAWIFYNYWATDWT